MPHQCVAVFMEEEQKPVETEHDQNEQHERQGQLEADSVPEIPVVRTNTPRPFSFDAFIAQNGQSGLHGQPGPVGWQREPVQSTDEMLSAFPHEAPSAPPVPEEVDEQEEHGRTTVAVESTPLPLAPSVAIANETIQEFVWLFEYGMEMDSVLLNSPDRLNNAALLYGPAVLKGYSLAFAVIESQQQKVVATIAQSPVVGAEVWGIVYRIPRRLTEQDDNQLSLLDRVHGAVPPGNVFEHVEVVVTEAYRGRELTCLTYITAHLPHIEAAQVTDSHYVQRLLEIARKQKLPDDYLQALTVSRMAATTTNTAQSLPAEQNTEPLPVVVDTQNIPFQTPDVELVQPAQSVQSAQPAPVTPLPPSHDTGLVVFACVSSVLLLAALALAIIQGSGIAGDTFTTSFTPLNVPWYVLLYGLIGGSISGLVTLGRMYGRTVEELPVFVIIVWCSRPFIGVVLAMLAYLLLNSGLFVLTGNTAQHAMLASLLAVLSGFCEGWLFKKQIS